MIRKPLFSTTALGVGMICAVSCLATAASTQAQTAPSAAPMTVASAAPGPTSPSSTDQLGEVVVTARARAEKQIDVPISIQTFSASQLAADNISDLSTLQFEAGFTFNSQNASFFGGGRNLPTLVFRGMTSNLPVGTANTGALFVDGVFISSGEASVTMADVSQVEVLKGPQNVYFGKNTFGGAVNLITSNPTEDYHGAASVGYSDLGSYDDVGSVEGAIIPGILTGRLTGEIFHQGEQYKSVSGGPLGEEDTKGVTLSLYATPTPDLWLKSRIHYSHDDDSEPAEGFISGQTYGEACPGMVADYFCKGNIPSLASGLKPQAVLEGTAISSAFLTAIGTKTFPGDAAPLLLNKAPTLDHPGLVRDNWNASLEGGLKLPYDASFQFSAGYNQETSVDIGNSDLTPSLYLYDTAFPVVARDFEADARILTSSAQPLRFVVGLNYFRSIFQNAYDNDFLDFIYDNSGPTNETDEAEAVYASAEYDITSYLTLTGEVRYQRDTVKDTALDGLPTTLLTPVEVSYNHALPRAILKYHPSKDTNVYLSYSEGVQPPQLQASYVGGDAVEKTYLASLGASNYTPDPTVRVWEIGWKQSLLKNRIFFSIDYYNQFWDNSLVNTILFNNPANNCNLDSQVGTSAACPLPGGGGAVTNSSNQHIQGIEFDGTAKITPQWTAHMAFNWTHAIRTSYSDQSWGAAFTSGVVPNQNGKVADLVPALQGSWDTTYKDHLVGDYNWYAHGVVTYTGPQYVEATDIAQIAGYVRVNGSVGITKGNLDFNLYVSNLLNDKNWDWAVRFPSPYGIYSEANQGVIAGAPNPRDFGFKISDKF